MTPGFCLILHTFGCKLDFHPHIHMLFSSGGIDKNGKCFFDDWSDEELFSIFKDLIDDNYEKQGACPIGLVSFTRTNVIRQE